MAHTAVIELQKKQESKAPEFFPKEPILIHRPCLLRICLWSHPAAKLLSVLLFHALDTLKEHIWTEDTFTLTRTQEQLVINMCHDITAKTIHNVAIPVLLVLGILDTDEYLERGNYKVNLVLIRRALSLYNPLQPRQPELEKFLITGAPLEKFLIVRHPELEKFPIQLEKFPIQLEKVLIYIGNFSNSRRGPKTGSKAARKPKTETPKNKENNKDYLERGEHTSFTLETSNMATASCVSSFEEKTQKDPILHVHSEYPFVLLDDEQWPSLIVVTLTPEFPHLYSSEYEDKRRSRVVSWELLPRYLEQGIKFEIRYEHKAEQDEGNIPTENVENSLHVAPMPSHGDVSLSDLTRPDNRPDNRSYSPVMATHEQGEDDAAPVIRHTDYHDCVHDRGLSTVGAVRERSLEQVGALRPCDVDRDRSGSDRSRDGDLVDDPSLFDAVGMGHDGTVPISGNAPAHLQIGTPEEPGDLFGQLQRSCHLPSTGPLPAVDEVSSDQPVETCEQEREPVLQTGPRQRKPRKSSSKKGKKIDLDRVEKVAAPPMPEKDTPWTPRKVLAWGDYFRGYLLPTSERKGSRCQKAQEAAVRVIQRGITESTYVSVTRYMRGVVTATLENDPDFRDEWWPDNQEADVWHVEENLSEMVRKIKAKAEKKEKGAPAPTRPSDKKRPYEAPVRLYGQAEAPPAGWYEQMYGKKPAAIGGRA